MQNRVLGRDRGLRSFVKKLRDHLGMFVPTEDFSGASALLLGYDLGSERNDLPRFEAWLVKEYGVPPNLSWMSAVLCLARCPTNADVRLSPDEQRRAVSCLFDLLIEFTEDEQPGDHQPSGNQAESD